MTTAACRSRTPRARRRRPATRPARRRPRIRTAGGSGIQTSQQQAGTDQLALALSAAAQAGASNANLPVRVLSPGDDGSVTQGNSVGSQATSGNTATTGQTATQDQSSACSCSGSGSGIQTATQSAGTGQESGAASTATQVDPSNTNVSIRVLSPGDDGSVSQANTRRLAGHVRQHRDDRPDEHPGPERPVVRLQRFGLRHPVRKAVGGHGAGVGGALDGDAGSSVEHERLDPGAQPR